MADIATIWDPASGTGDWAIDAPSQVQWTDEHGNSITDEHGAAIGASFAGGSGLVSAQDLYTAALISIFTDAQAGDDDIIPDGSTDRRGWWADPTMGSTLWLYSRGKATPDLPARIKHCLEQSLAWLIEDDVVAAIDVTVAYFAPTMIGAVIVFRRRDGARLAVRFSNLWESV